MGYSEFIYRGYLQDIMGLKENPKEPGTGDRLGPIGDVEFTVDAGRVGFNGPWRYDELPGDLLVGPAKGHEMEYFQLTLAQWFNQGLF